MAKRALFVANVGLCQRVGEFFEVESGTPTTTTDPTKQEITNWLNEAQNVISRLCPAQFMRELLEVADPSLSGSIEEYPLISFTSPNYCIQIHSATLCASGTGDDLPMRRVTPAEAALRVTNSLIQDATNPIFWLEENKVKWQPTTTGNAATGKFKLHYVKAPTAMSADADVSSIAIEFEEALIYYAAARGKEQDEEWQQAGELKTLFMRELQAIMRNWR